MKQGPKCRLCGHNHWSSDPHKWPDEPKQPVTNTVTNKVKSVTNTKDIVTNKAGDKVRVSAWRVKNRERYNEYMKNLMREKRSKVL